ncbi:hypothetical protein EVAR_41801_1 [Eumeta japonica]|uniref:Uncharacterized protein n=1 Tax=Eumeta variegata TaxID=151549 RepID=A0A4C1W1A5_EUMVA|nr:hypothetical protein EVAR_41801_1 [Eumeta japonica]
MGSQLPNYQDHLCRHHGAYSAMRCKCVIPSNGLPDEEEVSRHTTKEICKKNLQIVLDEFITLTSTTLKVHKATCEGMLGLYQDKSDARQMTALEDVETATYDDNDSQTILKGKISIIHMAAYSATNNLVDLD